MDLHEAYHPLGVQWIVFRIIIGDFHAYCFAEVIYRRREDIQTKPSYSVSMITVYRIVLEPEPALVSSSRVK